MNAQLIFSARCVCCGHKADMPPSNDEMGLACPKCYGPMVVEKVSTKPTRKRGQK